MEISSSDIKALREETSVSVMQCKKALEEAAGDMEKARVILAKKGAEAAAKKSDREIGAGAIGSYVHNTGEVAAMVVLGCETDFVSKNEEFVAVARDIALHVAAMSPKYITRDEVDEKAMEAAKAVFMEEVKDKPEEMQEKILEGKITSYFKESILMEQSFVKNPEQTIADLVNAATQKFGERAQVVTMSRVSVK